MGGGSTSSTLELEQHCAASLQFKMLPAEHAALHYGPPIHTTPHAHTYYIAVHPCPQLPSILTPLPLSPAPIAPHPTPPRRCPQLLFNPPPSLAPSTSIDVSDSKASGSPVAWTLDPSYYLYDNCVCAEVRGGVGGETCGLEPGPPHTTSMTMCVQR